MTFDYLNYRTLKVGVIKKLKIERNRKVAAEVKSQNFNRGIEYYHEKSHSTQPFSWSDSNGVTPQ
jgi:hypothetical protein